jgi:hypothetical protein
VDAVCCRACGRFVADAVGDGGGLGRCQVYEDGLAASLSRLAMLDLLRDLGVGSAAPVFWGGGLCNRVCLHYVAADNNNF